MQRISLGGRDWVFAGFHGEDWRWRGAFKRDTQVKGWQPAEVPGSVHWDLLRLGEIPDPYYERNSRLVEWVHQRQWVYKKDFTVPAEWDGRRVFLQFGGVDYEAEFYLDGELLGKSDSMMAPVTIEVTANITAGSTHHLAVVLYDAPREWPQIGRTSTVHTQKARFGYWWDFATRLVHLGIWQDVTLFATGPARLTDVWVRPRLNADRTQADVSVSAYLECPCAGEPTTIAVTIVNPAGATVAQAEVPHQIAPGSDVQTVTLPVISPELWWANGQEGGQPLYRCLVQVGDSDSREVAFGIRSFELQQNPWPPEGVSEAEAEAAEKPLPYTFTVNGERLFIKGYNWVPVDHLYGRADLGERYAQLIEQARQAGVNLLRVWGGGLLERERFYDLCDRAGILVWQEFFQSSSGTDNVPPTDPEFLARIEREAEGVIPLRRNHPSLAVWCGGNELTDWEKKPAGFDQPALALLKRKVAQLDPDRPIYPTSPSGPSFGVGDAVERPADLHDVHGGWHYRGPVDTYLAFNASTALFHSEFGTQGSAAGSSLDRFMAPERQWPPNDTNPNWVHHGAWWMQQHRVRELFGESIGEVDLYWRLSQYLQAEGLRYGVESNRRRWPQCSGTIIWQLNEPWPNSHCTTVVDYYLRPKMGYYYVKKAYAPAACSLRYESPILKDGVLRAVPFVVSDRPFAGLLQIKVTDASGRLWHQEGWKVEGAGVSQFPSIDWPLPDGAPDAVICTLMLDAEDGTVIQTNPYLFSRAGQPIFESLMGLPQARLSVRREGDQIVLRNDGPVYAFFPAVDIDDARWYWHLSDNYPLLAPGEECAITLTLTPRLERADTDFPHGRPVPDGPLSIRVGGWNTAGQTLTWEV
jgi:beta-mannosidase